MQKIAHRDIKPQNILLGEDGSLKLVDFGSGSISDGKAQKLTGTPLYMSPEQHPDFRHFQETGSLPTVRFNPYYSDVYSLAITFLHLALLRAPLDLLAATEPRKIALSGYLREVNREYPQLYEILAVMLAEEPHLRPEFWEILKQVNTLIPTKSDNFPVIEEEKVLQSHSSNESISSEPCANAYYYPEFNTEYPDAPAYISSIAETRVAYAARIYTQCAGCLNPDYVENFEDFGGKLAHANCFL